MPKMKEEKKEEKKNERIPRLNEKGQMKQNPEQIKQRLRPEGQKKNWKDIRQSLGRWMISNNKAIVIFILTMLLLSGCGSEKPLRYSEVLITDKAQAAEKAEIRKNECPALDIPTEITKIGDTWFIVDCYHDQIIYNDNLDDPLTEWLVMTDEMSRGHTIAGDGTVYLADDTENERIMVFEKEGDKFLFTQQFSEVGSRPHYVVYDEGTKLFYAWCSMSGEMYIFAHDKNDSRVYLKEIKKIPELKEVYVRSFTIMGNEIYFVSGKGSIIKADKKSFKVLSEYPVPSSMAGMVQITKIDDWFYITISTDDKWNQDYATIIRCRSLQDLTDGGYEDVYKYFIGGGTPYYITKADGCYYLTEHRIPGHSIWRFSVEGDEIKAETVY